MKNSETKDHRISYNPIIIGRVNTIGLLKTSKNKHKNVELLFDIKSTVLDDNNNQIIDYHSIKAYDYQARLVLKYLKSGDLCCIEGKCNNKSNIIIAERIVFLSSHEQEQLSAPKEINIM